jgi:hypothetical protein
VRLLCALTTSFISNSTESICVVMPSNAWQRAEGHTGSRRQQQDERTRQHKVRQSLPITRDARPIDRTLNTDHDRRRLAQFPNFHNLIIRCKRKKGEQRTVSTADTQTQHGQHCLRGMLSSPPVAYTLDVFRPMCTQLMLPVCA